MFVKPPREIFKRAPNLKYMFVITNLTKKFGCRNGLIHDCESCGIPRCKTGQIITIITSFNSNVTTYHFLSKKINIVMSKVLFIN